MLIAVTFEIAKTMKVITCIWSKPKRDKCRKIISMSSLYLNLVSDVIILLVIGSLPPQITCNKINTTNYFGDGILNPDYVMLNRTVSEHYALKYTNASVLEKISSYKVNGYSNQQAGKTYGEPQPTPSNYDEYDEDDGDDDDDGDLNASDINANYKQNLLYTTTTRITSCNSCRMREELKTNSLLSIQAHVLQKLGFDHPPNITKDHPPPPVPESIIKDFYNSTGYPFSQHDPQEHDPDRMMSDQPTMRTSKFEPGHEIIEEDDDYFSVTEKIYAFPTINKIRHNREILSFHFSNIEHTMAVEAILNIYVRGDQFFHPVEPVTRYFNISVHRVVKSPTQPENLLLLTEAEHRFEMPHGEGQFTQINVTKLVHEWFTHPNSNHGMILKMDSMGRKVVIVDGSSNSGKGPYIEIQTRDTRRRRTKRHLTLTCLESDNQSQCCRYPLTVDFDRFGWEFVIAPKRYEANYCSGDCGISFLPRYTHTHMIQLSSSVQPCCSPRRMSSLKLLYFDRSFNVVHTVIPNMAVEACSCS